MEITHVEVRKLYTFGNYENISFGYTAKVEEHDNPQDVQLSLITQIELDYAQFKADRQAHIDHRQVESRVSYDISAKKRELESLTSLVNKTRSMLENIGVETDQINHFLPSDDLPF